MSALQQAESTQFACSLVQTVVFPRHRGIARHLRNFRGTACYSTARGKPWSLVICVCYCFICLSRLKVWPKSCAWSRDNLVFLDLW